MKYATLIKKYLIYENYLYNDVYISNISIINKTNNYIYCTFICKLQYRFDIFFMNY
uniref:Uncharacterized protein n=1 Tax=Chondria sp. (in: red algae) TaxID=1982705 RepID=A0A1Z1MRF3_9FLOR|nr:hypothetical protein [Chondria sp. (in: red algae)]